MSEGPAFETISAAQLRINPQRALRLAGMIWSSQPLFYEMISQHRAGVHSDIASQIAEPAFDMPHVLIMRDLDDVALVCDIATASLASAQKASLAMLVKQVPKSAMGSLFAQMRDYAKTIEPIESDGRYVSHVAVVPERRGQGLGRAVMCEYLSRLEPTPVHLHVHRDNSSAIALYRSLGFEPKSEARYLFPAFTRALRVSSSS